MTQPTEKQDEAIFTELLDVSREVYGEIEGDDYPEEMRELILRFGRVIARAESLPTADLAGTKAVDLASRPEVRLYEGLWGDYVYASREGAKNWFYSKDWVRWLEMGSFSCLTFADYEARYSNERRLTPAEQSAFLAEHPLPPEFWGETHPATEAAHPPATTAFIPFLSDCADGVRGHYAIGRIRDDGTSEYWNLRSHEWAACSDEVLTLTEAQDLLRKIVITRSPSSQGDAPPAATGQGADGMRELSDERLSQLESMAEAAKLTLLITGGDSVHGVLELIAEVKRLRRGAKSTTPVSVADIKAHAGEFVEPEDFFTVASPSDAKQHEDLRYERDRLKDDNLTLRNEIKRLKRATRPTTSQTKGESK